MPIPVIRPKKEDVLKCIARFDEIPAVDGGLPDQKVEGCYRTFRNAIGFAQPDGEAVFSPSETRRIRRFLILTRGLVSVG